MRVHFDEQAFIFNRRGGIRRYFTELITALTQQTDVDARLSFRFTLPGDVKERLGSRGIPGPDRLGRRAAFAANTPNRRMENRADVIHRTYYHSHFVRRDNTCPVVYSVFDFIPERYPQLFRGGTPHLAKSQALLKADGLLCISEFTRRELLDFFPSLDVPVAVTPLGVSEWWFETPLSARNHPNRPFLLFVGRRDGYKDFEVAAQAFAQAGLTSHQLVLAGGGALSEDEVRKLTSLGIGKHIVALNPDDDQLRDLYTHADAFIFPSRMEGFGLPTLEALAAGCPSVILADTPISREVAGDHGRYFTGGSSEALADLLTEAVGVSEIERAHRSDQGRNYAQTYSWSRTAAKTVEAYLMIHESAQ